jgi:hypothetical protein
MPGSFHIDPDRRLVFSRAWGVVTDASMRDHVRQLAAHPAFRPDFNQVADIRGAQLDISTRAVRLNADSQPFEPTSRRAIVVSDDLAFGMSRMFQLLTGADNRVLVCRTLAEAFAWVGLPADTPWPVTESPDAP